MLEPYSNENFHFFLGPFVTWFRSGERGRNNARNLDLLLTKSIPPKRSKWRYRKRKPSLCRDSGTRMISFPMFLRRSDHGLYVGFQFSKKTMCLNNCDIQQDFEPGSYCPPWHFLIRREESFSWVHYTRDCFSLLGRHVRITALYGMVQTNPNDSRLTASLMAAEEQNFPVSIVCTTTYC